MGTGHRSFGRIRNGEAGTSTTQVHPDWRRLRGRHLGERDVPSSTCESTRRTIATPGVRLGNSGSGTPEGDGSELNEGASSAEVVPLESHNVIDQSGQPQHVADRSAPYSDARPSGYLEYSWSGPLPHAADLAAYNDVQAGLADRIVRMAEREQDHRHSMDLQELRQPFELARRGQSYGLASLLVLAALAGYLAYLGHPGWAVVVGSIDFLAIVAVFVTGKNPSDDKTPKLPEASETSGSQDQPTE